LTIKLNTNSKRIGIRLGKMPAKIAEQVRRNVSYVVAAKIADMPIDSDTARWLAGIDDTLYRKFSRVGLVAPRAAKLVEPATTIGGFLTYFIGAHTEKWKATTKSNWKQTEQQLLKFFDKDRDIKTIDAASAEDFESFMLKGDKDAQRKPLKKATAARHIGRCKQLFRKAIKRRVYREENPFEGMNATVRSDPKRKANITHDTIRQVLAHCTDPELRALIVLGRYQGLRIPSEPREMVWSDVGWDTRRLRVPSPKTEHHEGREQRVMPLFDETREALLELAGGKIPTDGTARIFPDLPVNSILRRRMHQVIERAGMTPWPKVFVNLRSTCETELAEDLPLQAVCEFLGNTPKVAREHYLQTLESHYEKALDKSRERRGERRMTTHGSAKHGTAKTNPQNPGKTAPHGTTRDPAGSQKHSGVGWCFVSGRGCHVEFLWSA
jgi:hypothetical protein